MMKKLLSMMVVAGMISFSMTACGGETEEGEGNEEQTEQTEETTEEVVEEEVIEEEVIEEEVVEMDESEDMGEALEEVIEE